MNITVDVGNTSVKAAIFEGDELLDRFSFSTEAELKSFLENFSGRNVIISSVSREAAEIGSWIKADGVTVITLSPWLSLPVRNMYKTPETLGMDRLAGACGAKALFPLDDCLVVDIGTCIKYDFVDSRSVYHGGAISPGLTMRFKAMNAFTARLPLVELNEQPDLIGNTTRSCLQSGVFYGMAEEINGIIGNYKEKFPGLRAILTGGDSHFFENKLKASIFASPELVLRGLNSILLHNVSIKKD
jgi:type III pantothenate kinase